MDELELAWQTYDFHTCMIYELEEKHKSAIKYYERFVKRNLNPSQTKKTYVRNKLNKSFSLMLTAYNKQLKAIDDLIELYKKDIDIPAEREANPQLFFDLKNVTSTLMEEIKIFRREINEVLR